MKDALKNVLDKIKHAVDYADARLVTTRSEKILVKNGAVDSIADEVSKGFGIRVIVDGCWGFSSSSVLTEAEAARVAQEAIEIAKATKLLKKWDVVLSEEEPKVDTYKTKIIKDPFSVSLDDKISILLEADRIMRKNRMIRVSEGSMQFYRIDKVFLSTEGADIEQTIIESGAGIAATAIGNGDVQKRSYPASWGDTATRGFEFVQEMKLVDNAEKTAEEAAALLKAPDCPTGELDLIICGSQLALQVHESCGHPTELDRVFGTEASFAGTSFLTVEKMGNFRYGSEHVSIFQDATCEGGLGTFGYDDEGVPAQRTPIVDKGIFVGYLTSRETAARLKQKSNGCMRADGWNRIPLIRMTNINLEPGDWELDDLIRDTKDGLMVDSNKSWSIDDKRLNFQFGTEIAWRIRNGKIEGLVKNAVYTGITPEFWASCDAVCNAKYWHIWGIPSCGKGEPMQVAHVA
ncbi:MAG TPA: TldD/PmbA family protein, partial [Firmicutes bacterium]|nr:TldD/PmbA family protein [Bacillota bacterium]